MKSSRFGSALRLEPHPPFTQELPLFCRCCGQPYYPDKAWKKDLLAKRTPPSAAGKIGCFKNERPGAMGEALPMSISRSS
jgi:hypothetical protein